MKKLILLMSLVACLAISCNTGKNANFTIIGDGTPYYFVPEKLMGHVQTVIEKNYWAIPDGESYKKGNPLTKTDRDSLGGWTDDFEATFDNDGNLLTCQNMDENGKAFRVYKVFKADDGTLKGENLMTDTLNYWDRFKLDKDGKRIGYDRFAPKADTISLTFNIRTNPAGDTLEYQSVNAKGEAQYKFLVLFDKEGQFLRSESFDRKGVLQFVNEVKYNDKGKISEGTGYDKDKKLVYSGTYIYEYDKKGNWVKVIGKTNKNQVVLAERTIKYF